MVGSFPRWGKAGMGAMRRDRPHRASPHPSPPPGRGGAKRRRSRPRRGSVCNTASISAGRMFTPPEVTMSAGRSTMNRKPSSVVARRTASAAVTNTRADPARRQHHLQRRRAVAHQQRISSATTSPSPTPAARKAPAACSTRWWKTSGAMALPSKSSVAFMCAFRNRSGRVGIEIHRRPARNCARSVHKPCGCCGSGLAHPQGGRMRMLAP